MAQSMKRKRKIDPKQYYTISQTAIFLRDGGVKTPETVKRYCRSGKLKGKKKGPKKVWYVLGSSVTALRKDWELDE
jgi:hypothetical protein